MKKIIVFLGMAIFLTAGSVYATSVWNGASNDCPSIAIANYTTNVGYVTPCWPLTTVSASNGDVVNVRIYYHNTSSSNNTNTRVFLTAQTGSSTIHSFSGQITSDQGNISFGPVKVTTANNTTISFGGTHWLPNQQQTEVTLLNGQTGSEILGSSGLYLGTIEPGWNTQGSVVVAFSIPEGGNGGSSPTGTLTAANSSCSIPLGGKNCQINFSWNTTNPVGTSAITQDGGGTVATGNSGSKALTVPYNGATFRLYNNAIELDSETVTSYCTNGTSWNGNVCAENVTPTYSCSITNFTVGGALSTTVTLGNSVELAWTTTGCDYVNITNVGNYLPANGSQTVYPSSSGTYKLTGYGGTGTNPTRTVSVTVNPVTNPTYSCSISSFTADGLVSTTVRSGDSVDIHWNTSNCTTINISNVGSNLSSSGSHIVYPTTTTRYVITASGLVGGTQTRYVDVTVKPNTTTSYACSIEDFEASNTYITSGQSTNLYWNTENCNSVKITNLGNVSDSGNRTLYPASTTNYVLTAYGSIGGTQTRNILVTVGPYNYNNNNYTPTPIYNTCTVTTVATNITGGGATLNGLISNSNNTNSNVYFEYGPSINLGSRTPTRTVSGNSSFSETISGLSPNTSYFFRAVGDCNGGNALGSYEVFTTEEAVKSVIISTSPKTTISQGTTIIGNSSPVMLKIDNRYKLIGVGDILEYTIYYKNIGRTTLTNPILQVIVPKGITITNSSRGTYSSENNQLFVELEDLPKGADGYVYLQGKVNSITTGYAQIVTTAILVYTNSNGAQENAIAYVLNNPKEMATANACINGATDNSCDTGNNLKATAVFGWAYSIGLIGWLIIILIVLLIILLVRSLYIRKITTVHQANPQTPGTTSTTTHYY